MHLMHFSPLLFWQMLMKSRPCKVKIWCTVVRKQYAFTGYALIQRPVLSFSFLLGILIVLLLFGKICRYVFYPMLFRITKCSNIHISSNCKKDFVLILTPIQLVIFHFWSTLIHFTLILNFGVFVGCTKPPHNSVSISQVFPVRRSLK